MELFFQSLFSYGAPANTPQNALTTVTQYNRFCTGEKIFANGQQVAAS